MNEVGLEKDFKEIVDYLMPELTTYELTVYLLLYRLSIVNGKQEIRLGKRTIGGHIKGARSQRSGGAFSHITEILKSLEQKGCIKIGTLNREGSLYMVVMPAQIPMVKEKLQNASRNEDVEDYFNLPAKRKMIFERDNYNCQYCGDKVTNKTATLDHKIPVSKGGSSSKDNLVVCCFECNSIKSGKTLEEVATILLERKKNKNMKK